MDLKTCTCCGIPKDRSEFHARAASPDGLRPSCKECRKNINRQDYLKNRQKRIEQATAYRKADPEAYNAYRRDLQARKTATDQNYRLRRRLRLRLYQVLKDVGAALVSG
jgi:hypothetical protein